MEPLHRHPDSVVSSILGHNKTQSETGIGSRLRSTMASPSEIQLKETQGHAKDAGFSTTTWGLRARCPNLPFLNQTLPVGDNLSRNTDSASTTMTSHPDCLLGSSPREAPTRTEYVKIRKHKTQSKCDTSHHPARLKYVSYHKHTSNSNSGTGGTCSSSSKSISSSSSINSTPRLTSSSLWIPRCSSVQLMFLLLPPVMLLLLPDVGVASLCIERFSCETGQEKRVVKCVDAAIDVVPMCLNPSLLQLSLHSTKIHALYLVSLRFYTDLRHVNLSDNEINHIEEKSFECQPHLEELHLANNKLSALHPDTFVGLHNLTVLSLQGNLLEEIPDRTFHLLRRLELLDLSHNRLQVIGPLAFANLPHLRVLHLSNNMLPHVPGEALSEVPHLAELSLGTNLFTELAPEDLMALSTLTALDLSGAQLKNGLFPSSFSALQGLRLLRLEDCGLENMPTEALGVLERLEELYLSRNMFKELGSDVFSGSHRLQTLEIVGCPELERVSSDAFKSTLDLRRLSIARNPKLWLIPAGTFRFLTQMTYLDLHANNIQTLQREVAVWNDIPIWLIHGNPIECNCSVAWLRGQLDANSTKPTTYCATPPHLKGRALATAELSELSCGLGPATQGLVIGIVVVVALALIIGAVAILLYRQKRPFLQDMLKRPDWNSRSEWNGRGTTGSTCSRDLRAYPHDYPEYIMAPHKPVPVTEL